MFGVLICEDVWSLSTVQQLAQLNIDTALVLNASPYEVGKPQHRIDTMAALVKQLNINLVYCNQVGGQDDLILTAPALYLINQAKWLYKRLALKRLVYR